MELPLPGQYKLATHYVTEAGVVRNQLSSFNQFVDQSLEKIVKAHAAPELPSKALQLTFEKVRVCPPTLVNESDRTITPEECRLRGLTYEGRILANVRVKSPDGEVNAVEEHVIGYLPIMLRSNKCVLHKKSELQQIELQEDYHDPGGYFIVNGTERVVLMYEQTVANRIIVAQLDGITTASVVSDTHERKSKCELVVKDKRLTLKNVIFGPKGCNFVIVLRAMGVETDQEICQLIGSDSLFQEYIQQSLFECQAAQIFTQKQALAFISQLNPKPGPRRGSKITETLNQLANYFLCHINCTQVVKNESATSFSQSSVSQVEISQKFSIEQQVLPKQNDFKPYQRYFFTNKLNFLAEMARRVILTAAGYLKPTDRDFYGSKRIELCADLFSLIFEDSFRNAQQTLIKKLSLKKSFTEKDIFQLITSDRVTAAFRQALSTGNVTLDRFKYSRIGASEVVSRLCYISALGEITRLNSSFNKDLKATGPRMLNASQYGICCPTDTPEGESVGLVKNLAALAEISTYEEENVLKSAIFALGTENLETCQENGTLVYLNGGILGRHANPVFLVTQLRLLRMKGKLSPMTSIAYNSDMGDVSVCCDAGRPCRPLLVVDKNNNLKLTKEDMESISDGEMAVKDLIKQGKIEILDVEEAATADIGYELEDLQYKKCTHLELHCLAVFGVVASLIPFPHHNQSPRNVFECAMGKEAIGLPCLNIQNRFDTLLLQLSYPEAPITTTKLLNEATNYMKMPAGQNAIVCITSFSGYDIEDAIILNRASIDRGFGRCDVYKCVESEITESEKIVGLPVGMEEEQAEIRRLHTPERYEDCQTPLEQNDEFKETGEYFKLPDKERLEFQYEKFHAIDTDGLPWIGSIVEDGDVLVNKIESANTANSASSFSNTEETYHSEKDTHASVDRVMITNSQQLSHTSKIVKVMTHEHRFPYYGDKFSSRHGQKGTVGLIVNETDMPFSPVTGIVPDLIMNPHGFPSRMTMGKQLELMSSKAAVLRGKYADGTIFKDCELVNVCSDLEHRGYNYTGKDVLVNGLTGELCPCYVFEGPIFYERLKHMVNDKMHARGEGPVSFLTRQPLEGRAKQGGLRLGEMEKDVFISYGTSYLLNERMIKASDEYSAAVCPECGILGQFGWCRYCQSGEMRVVKIPYAAKLLTQEMMSMGILMRFKLE